MMYPSKRRVCVLTTSYPDYPGSYRGIFVQRAVRQLIERGYEISVVTPKLFRRSKRFEENPGERIYRFPFLSEEKLLVEYDKVPIWRMITYMLSGFLYCARIARKDRCRLIHAHFVIPTGLIAVLVGCCLKIPVIIQAHGSDMTKYARLNRWMAWLTTFAAKQAHHLIVVSQELSRILVQELAVPTHKITVRSCGIDTMHFRSIPRDQAREHIKLPEEAFIVLFVGSLITRKGVDILLAAFAGLVEHDPTATLIVVGEGPLRQELEAQTHDLGIEKVVHFVGPKSNEELPIWYSSADIFVLPSLREGVPLVLLEALSCGLPVIVSRAGGMSELVVHGKNGLLVDIGDPTTLERHMRMLLREPHLRTQFRDAARDTVLRWGGTKEEIDAAEDLYHEYFGGMERTG